MLLFAVILFLITGCEDQNEVPPRSESNVKDYVLPKAQPLTNADRQEVNDRQKEYDESLK